MTTTAEPEPIEPRFTISTAPEPVSLFELLHRIQAGESFDLSRMQAHQRAQIVTAIAITQHAIRRYAISPPGSPADWECEWDRQIGRTALRLVAPDREPAFFQPIRAAGGDCGDTGVTGLDVLITGNLHPNKPVAAADAETAMLALLSGTWARNLTKRPGVKRHSPAGVLVSEDGSFSSEVRFLMRTYELGSATLGRNATGRSAADHLLWLLPDATTGLDPDRIPYPWIENRPARLSGTAEAMTGTMAYSVPKTIVGEINPDDPHTPTVAGAAKSTPFRLGPQRGWTLKAVHTLLVGGVTGAKEPVIRPRILDLDGYRVIRVFALPTDNGKNLGYRDVVFPLAPAAAFSLCHEPDRATALSTHAVDTARSVSGWLSHAEKLLRGEEHADARTAADSIFAEESLVSLTGALLAQLAQPADEAADIAALNAAIHAVAGRVWSRIELHSARPLRRARANRYLTDKLARLRPRDDAAEPQTPMEQDA